MTRRSHRMRNHPAAIVASAEPDQLHAVAFTGEVRMEAAGETGADGKPRNRRFKMTAYTGGAMRPWGFGTPVVVELSGIDAGSGKVPVLAYHNPDDPVGQTDKIEVSGKDLIVSGEIIDVTAKSKEIVAAADRGFRWNVSIGANITEREFVGAGTVAKVNGQDFTGPLIVARKTELTEVSFVSIGADRATSAAIAAKENQAMTMPAQNHPDNAAQQAALENSGPNATGSVAASGAPANPEHPKPEVTAGAATDPAAAQVQSIRAAAAAEHERITALQDVCGDKHGKILAQAIKDGWTKDRTELEVLRASRPQAPAGIVRSDELNQNVLCAAAAFSARLGEDKMLKAYGEQAVTAAHKYRGIGVQDFFRLAARAEGIDLPIFSGNGGEFIRAAFSTVSLPGILANVANKALLEGYNYVESAWRQVCKIGSVSDFKQHTRYRLTDDMIFQKLGPDGEIKHGSVGEQSFTQQADTFARMFSLTRQMIINDDLSAFMELPKQLGMGAAEAIADALWTLLLSNPSTFYGTGNKNYISGADTALSYAALETGYAKFMKQTKPNGRPLGLEPAILLVPTELRTTADRLFKSELLIPSIATTGSAATVTGDANVFAGKFRVVSSTYLSNSSYTGYSTTAWYLLADPNILPTMEVAFLNGQETPTVEQADADFNTLGIQFRGYLDFGVAMLDHRGGVKSKGAS